MPCNFATESIISTAYLHSFLRYIILLLQYPGGDALGWQVLLFHWLVLKLLVKSLLVGIKVVPGNSELLII